MTDGGNNNHNNLAVELGGEGIAYMKIWDKVKKKKKQKNKIIITRVRFLHGISQYFVSVSDFLDVNMNPITLLSKKDYYHTWKQFLSLMYYISLSVPVKSRVGHSIYQREDFSSLIFIAVVKTGICNE